MSDMTKQAHIFEKILKKEENKLCADCRRKSPSWASLNLGVLICMKCSGIHRGLGVHISKVKSVNLDKWPEDALANFQKINNKIANAYWESKLKDLNYEKLQDDDYKLNDLIRDKYERKNYCDIKKTDPMTLIIQGKIPEVKNDGEFKDVAEKDPNSSDEDRSTKRKTQKQKGFKVDPEANKFKTSSEVTNKKEPLFQINSNNTNLISFDNTNDTTENNDFNSTNNTSIQNQLSTDLFNNLNNNINNNSNNYNSSNNNTAKSKFGFISKNQNNNVNNVNNNNINLALFHSTPNMQNNKSLNGNNNIDNNLFNLNHKSNSDLMDLKSGDLIAEEKLKKITDNIDELYKSNNNSFNNNNFYSSNEGDFSSQNITKNQNDLFNALNPQFTRNLNYLNNSQHPNANGAHNNYYNFNQNNQMNTNNQYNMSHINNFYPNANQGLGNGFTNQAGFNGIYQFNNPNNKSNFQQMNPINGYLNNTINRNNGLLTANDIYLKKDDSGFNLNLGNNSNCVNNSNSNFLEFNETKPRKNEDPFSNLISFK